jgi:hypothetical protein
MDSLPNRRTLRFGLTTLFVLLVIVSVPLAWKANQRHELRKRQLALAAEASTTPHVAYGRERDIFLALQGGITCTFADTPLDAVVGELQKQTGVPFILDKLALSDVGMGGDTPVTCVAQDERVETFLQRMLRDLEVTYSVQDGVVKITTIERLQKESADVRVYNAANLLDEDYDATALAQALHSTLTSGGDTSERIESVTAHKHLLIVRATPWGHRRFVKVLEMLKAGMRPNG